MARTSDYGGHSHERDHATVTQVSKKKCASMRCLDCGKLVYIPLRILDRRSRVHCLECGGSLEETEAHHKRRTGVTKAKAGDPLRVQFGPMQFECRHCYKQFRTEAAWKLHVKEQHEDF